MKKLFILILISSFSLSCAVSHPWSNSNIPVSDESFVPEEDLTPGLNLEGVYAYKVRYGNHIFILTDSWYNVSLLHDPDCSHGLELIKGRGF